MVFFEGIRYRMFRKKAIEEAQQTVNEYFRLGPLERSAAKAWSAAALAFLLENEETPNAIGFTRALTYMHGEIDNGEPDNLKKIHDQLISFQRQANASYSTANKCIANGMPLWILSIRGIMYPEIIVFAALAWDVIDNVDEDEYANIYEQIHGIFAGTDIQKKLSLHSIQHLERPRLFRMRRQNNLAPQR